MRRIAWATDLHLEFADDAAREALLESLSKCRAEALLIGGDTGVAFSFEFYLSEIADRFRGPVYFVLGNHDFYHGSIRQVRSIARGLGATPSSPAWLAVSGIVQLTPRTCLIGHDGWGDGRLGKQSASDALLNDDALIRDFASLPDSALFKKLNALGDEAADHIRQLLLPALREYQNVIILTHVPPFPEACLYGGRPTDGDFLPRFSCAAMGRVVRIFADAYPQRRITVLCGHTHGRCEIDITTNLRVVVGHARYGQPRLQEALEIP